VFYVGATRAREQLHIVQPQRDGGFIIWVLAVDLLSVKTVWEKKIY
jgi:superfamily I DNA/RNA helicase